MEWLGLWVFIGFIAIVLARSKGREGAGWWVYALVLPPLALLHAILLREPGPEAPNAALGADEVEAGKRRA